MGSVLEETLDSQLRCEIDPERERVVVRAIGEIDIANAGHLRQLVLQYVERGFARVHLDLSRLAFLDSHGMCEILDLARRLGDRLTLTQGPPAVQRIFQISGLIELLPFEPPRRRFSRLG
jgi:anti-anti-sigma factor